MDWRILRAIGQVLNEFKKETEVNGGEFNLKEFFEWIKEKTWTDYINE